VLTVGSLFAGIGGFDLGLERAGMRSVWQCEIDPYAIRVLEKHWPDVLRVRDIRELGAHNAPAVDVICGGFPCQDLSYAGKGAGLDGERSGLWSEYARVVGELRPRYVVVENVSALLARGLDRVLGDLAALGYDAEWDCLPASAFGAPHRRDRVWIVAYADRQGLEGHGQSVERAGERTAAARGGSSGAGAVGHADRASADALAAPSPSWPPVGERGWWRTEPDVGRVAPRVPARVDRLRSLGNALVPQIAEWIGRRIVDYEEGALSDAA
jgi:DNA (cytosine-5)-methyltransferase 1